MDDHPHADILRHTAHVVSAHLGHNKVAVDEVPGLIQSVYQALAGLGAEPEISAEARTPAVPVRRSVFPDYIVCLEDGAKMTMLKRYIMTRFSLTPAAYRERWGLPADYPMVAPNYTKTRSDLARQIGLGRKKEPTVPDAGTAPAAPAPEPQTEDSVTITKVPARRARGAKK